MSKKEYYDYVWPTSKWCFSNDLENIIVNASGETEAILEALKGRKYDLPLYIMIEWVLYPSFTHGGWDRFYIDEYNLTLIQCDDESERLQQLRDIKIDIILSK